MVYTDKTHSSNEISNHTRYTRLGETQSIIEESFLDKVTQHTKALDTSKNSGNGENVGNIDVSLHSSYVPKTSVQIQEEESMKLQLTIQKALSAYKENEELTKARDWGVRGNFA